MILIKVPKQYYRLVKVQTTNTITFTIHTQMRSTYGFTTALRLLTTKNIWRKALTW